MVEEVALERLSPFGQFVRREWLNSGLFLRCTSEFSLVILHRNLAFFQMSCKAVLEKIEYGELSEWSMVQHSKSCDILPNHPNNFIWKRIEVVVTSRTRNAVVRKGTWVRIPPLPPEKPQKRLA